MNISDFILSCWKVIWPIIFIFININNNVLRTLDLCFIPKNLPCYQTLDHWSYQITSNQMWVNRVGANSPTLRERTQKRTWKPAFFSTRPTLLSWHLERFQTVRQLGRQLVSAVPERISLSLVNGLDYHARHRTLISAALTSAMQSLLSVIP